MISEVQWEKAASSLQSARGVAVCCHISPDGDALGSMIGLGLFLRRQGKQVWMSWGSSEITIPSQYSFLPALDSIVSFKELPEEVEVFVAIDCADKSRLDLLVPAFDSAVTTLNIDHHVSNTDYADINLVDSARASSSEVGYELVKRMGGRPESAEALCFYTGIVTDTGRFQYANASPETLRTAADLRELGVDHQLVTENVYESESFRYLRVLGAVLSRAELSDGLIWSWMGLEDLGAIPMEETDNLIDSLRVVKEAAIAALFKQHGPTEWKVSLRSRTETDVSKIAQSFGGGGHQKAAGFTVQGELDEVVFTRADSSCVNGSESEVNGLAIVDKPAGCTSHDVVDRIRRLFEIKRVGHSGTLDPSATGMLLVGVGKATRLLAFLQGLPKSYLATAKFGITTASQDAQGEVVEVRPSAIDAEMVEAALAQFQGEIMQVPPMVSAIKIDGEPLYKAARRGEEVDRPARSVRIYEFRLAGVDELVQTATFVVRCSSGTYVRTLAADLGEALHTGAHLIALRRTSIGDFEEAEATPLEELESMGREAASAKLLSLSEAMRGFPIKRVGGPDLIAVANGRPLELGEPPRRPGELMVLATPRPGDRPSHEAGMSAGIPVAIHDLEGRLVAVYRKTGKGLKPAAVLAN